MSNFGQMKANIASFLRRSDLTTDIPIAINRAISHYSQEIWSWLEVRSTSLVTAPSVKTVALPTDFSSEIFVSLTVNAAKYELRKITMQELDNAYYSDTLLTNQPYLYAIWNDKFFLYPIPAAVYTLTVDYYAVLPVLVADADTNVWTNLAEELVESRATWWLAQKVMRNEGVALASKTVELEAYANLRREATLHASSGKIRSSTHRRRTWS